jgi:hypothetical protein
MPRGARRARVPSLVPSALDTARTGRLGERAMLYEFKSKATGNVVMTGPIAERLLAIVGREPSAKGIFTVEQMPEAIAALQAAVERERAESSQAEADADERSREAMRSVSLAQRAWPLIDMLRTAHAAKQPVTWGV